MQKDYQPFFVQYAKRGVPPTLRAKIYKKILNVEMSSRDYEYFAALKDHADRWELAIDDMLLQDAREVCNEDKFFIFEDYINTLSVLFFRDKYVLENIKVKPHAPILGIAGADRVVGTVPPAGILPCQGFPRYIAPFCYISDKMEEVYFIFREFYCKYLCHLHALSSNTQCIIGLCKFFEDLLQIYEPEVCYHLNQLSINPLKIAFQWIFYGFIGYLEIDQLYLLWDRIVGFENLEILAILAASIFVFRANLILNCSNQEEYDELFYDLSQIKVMPLIQHFLFAAGIN